MGILWLDEMTFSRKAGHRSTFALGVLNEAADMEDLEQNPDEEHDEEDAGAHPFHPLNHLPIHHSEW